jgi:hypothetical protein
VQYSRRVITSEVKSKWTKNGQSILLGNKLSTR